MSKGCPPKSAEAKLSEEALAALQEREQALCSSEEQVANLQRELASREEALTAANAQDRGLPWTNCRGAEEKLLSLGQAVTDRNNIIRQLQEKGVPASPR